jgi:hypothetical protein
MITEKVKITLGLIQLHYLSTVNFNNKYIYLSMKETIVCETYLQKPCGKHSHDRNISIRS